MVSSQGWRPHKRDPGNSLPLSPCEDTARRHLLQARKLALPRAQARMSSPRAVRCQPWAEFCHSRRVGLRYWGRPTARRR